MRPDAEGVLNVNDDIEEAVDQIMNFDPKISEVADLSVRVVENIDSTDMTPEIWDKLGSVIDEEYDDYEGFVITQLSIFYHLDDDEMLQWNRHNGIYGECPFVHLDRSGQARREFLIALRRPRLLGRILSIMMFSGLNWIPNPRWKNCHGRPPKLC